MHWKHALISAILFFLGLTLQAQINLFLGGNLQGNYSWLRGEEASFQPGFGGGVSFIYWEYEYWFLKTGIDYMHKTSSVLQYPDDFDEPVTSPDDRVRITYIEQSVGIPLTLYFRPYESGANTLLITGSFSMMGVAHLRESTEEFGDLVLKGADIKSRIKTGIGVGVGFQRQLDRQTYLNLVPSFNIDIRSPQAFQSITLTAELIFGIY
jgi:hypothetical protein